MKENLEIKKNIIIKENEVQFIRRTRENYTHDVLEDQIIEEITSWKISQGKHCQYILYSILSCGLIHIISKYRPLLFIKLYCIPSIPKEAEYFLIKNIYGEYTLCQKEFKRNNLQNNNYKNEDFSTEYFIGPNTNNINKSNSFTIGFHYNSLFYQYDEISEKIFPIFFNLSNFLNSSIYQLFYDGLSSENKVKLNREKYGTNECPINIKLTTLYFYRVELPILIFCTTLGLIEGIFGNISNFYLLILFFVIFFLLNYIFIKKLSFNNENTLEGEKTKIRVKRNYMNDLNNDFCFINNIDLVPGDIVYLEKDEYILFDGLILEGECVISSSELNGKIGVIRKNPLNKNNNKFNYKENQNSILFHGSKILNTYSKLKNNAILLLCINTGINTYKANQLTNIIHLFKRNTKYKSIYTILSGNNKNLFLFAFLIFLISSIIVIILTIFFTEKNWRKIFTYDFFLLIFGFLTRCYFPIYHMISCSIVLLTVFKLALKNIQCYDKSRIIHSGSINTIFFDKTGTLSEDKLELKGFSPIYICNDTLNPILKYYDGDHTKSLVSEIINYYNNYFHEIQLSNNNISKNFSKKIMVLFIESLMCCNCLEKVNNKIFGNPIEKEIFLQTKWKIKIGTNLFNRQLGEDNNIINNNKIFEKPTFNNFQKDKNSKYKINILEQQLEIYPSDYFKISKENKANDNNNSIQNNIFSTSYSSQNSFENKINSIYKLQIYRRFIKVGTLYSSAIVYNPLIKTLYFMTKGPPEEVIPNCNIEFLPKDITKIITLYRKNGYINLILAAKTISKFDKSLEEKSYMNNLIFCGIVILKNKLKKEAKQVINQLKNLNCDLILNTGDNVYNALTISYESGITSKKNIYVFDLDNNQQITFFNFTKFKNDEQLNTLEKNSKGSGNKLKSNKDIYSSNKIELFVNKLEKINSFLGGKKKDILEKKNEIYALNKNKLKIISSQRISNLNNIKNNVPKLTYTNLTNHLKKNISLIESDNENSISSNSKFILNKPSINSKTENTKEEFKNSNLLVTNKNFLLIKHIDINPSIKDKSSIKFKKPNKIRKSEAYMNKNMSSQKIDRQNSINKPNVFIKPKTLVFNKNSFQIDRKFNPIKLKEMREDCVYCVSGRAFKFIYENQFNVEYKKYEFPVLLNHIKNFCKIFYDMSSKDKSFLIDYYRSLPNKITCMVGDGQNDIDAIMTSHVGINIKQPVNKNTVLCHFHPIDGSLFCIEKIIRYGRVTYENINLLAGVTLLYAIDVIFYIISLYYFKLEVNSSQLDFVSIIFFFLCFFGFNAPSDKSIKSCPLFHNQSLTKKFFFIVGIINLILNFIFSVLMNKFYSKNEQIDLEVENKIVGTYHFLLCFFQIIGMFLSINSINFYRKEYKNNFIYMVMIIGIFVSLTFVIEICGNTIYPFSYNLLTFELSSKNVDTFDDRNKLIMFALGFGNIITSYILVYILLNIFKKKAEKDLEKSKNL